MTAAPVVLTGTIYCYRLYDVGDEIALEEAARLLRSEYRETRLGRKAAGAMQSFAVPLRVDLDSRKVTFGHTGQVLDVEMSIHFFDSGTASMCIEIPMAPGTSLDSLVPFCQELYESAELEALGRVEINKMLPHFAPAVSGRHDWDGFETFYRSVDSKARGRSAGRRRFGMARARPALGRGRRRGLAREIPRD